MEKPTFHFTLSGKKCCLFLLSQILMQLCYDLKDIAEFGVPRTCLPAIATTPDTEAEGHSRLFIQEQQLWKAWFSLPVFSYKLPDISFRKICQEIKI